ncbi:MAG: hypothetical protein A3G32_10040 [Deltaproteobacteria bacterium RIFCSPLOWO2_12_FULL_40_28]|nr:MAG: hypothetical protein A3C45_05050 [Deltaproteobacteria bacterium RIFCSPHIGHO2_02_FULL_40_28]OGQ20370.1 MAG: hypothetical protein A3E27_00430 [Deltaproteobacteria bacterium RIFCSPHIGHO2_12_FULL_40_32]OGQ41339.1 MAG: hypothetical protein A3I69_02080 [Deltaproteobacteria bacterium RIFCSPLOWO2_02_FULL_40_36]OGQ54978.1 MAG: hypothetical protein A3G32_10040 [Deltaproteobacteria bacterium RIFCSPLOWO2_12_FULL_40_28]
MKIKDFLPRFMLRQWEQWFKKMEGALVYFTPSYVAKNNHWFSPLIAVVALIMVVVLVGIAVGSFFSLFASLLVLYFILTKIFGIRLETGDIFVI